MIARPLAHELRGRGLDVSLADKVALRTSDYSIEEIAEEIAPVVRGA